MNADHIVTEGFFSPASEALYRSSCPDEPPLKEQCGDGGPAGGCASFAPFDAGRGLRRHSGSRHRFEAVSKHFTCGFNPAGRRRPPGLKDFLRCRYVGEIEDPEIRKHVPAGEDSEPRSPAS